MDNKTRFKWIILNFKNSVFGDKSLNSPTFTMQNFPHKPWFLNLDKVYANDHISVSVCSMESYEEHLFNFTMSLSIMDSSNQAVITLINRWTGKFEAKWFTIGLLNHRQLLDNLVENDLIFVFEIDVSFVCLEITAGNVNQEENSDNSFLNDKTFSDVTLHIGRKRIFAHKVILSSESKVFHEMFVNEPSLDRIKIDSSQVGYRDLMAVLRYFYTGKIEILPESALNILKVAHLYDSDELRDICSKSFSTNINIDNVVDTLMIADNCQAKILKETCLTKIQCNFEKIRNSRELEQLSRSHAHLLLEIIKELPIEQKLSPNENVKEFTYASSKFSRYS